MQTNSSTSVITPVLSYSNTLSAKEYRVIHRAIKLIKNVLIDHPVAMNNSEAVRDYLRLSLALEDREVFVCLWLDAHNRLIESEIASRGTLTQAVVYPRDLAKSALQYNAASVILAHNHPSGNSYPSCEDIHMTIRLQKTFSLIDIKVHDHFIIGSSDKIFSFAEEELPPFGNTKLSELGCVD